MVDYYVINLETVKIEKGHPYTLVFKGYIPTYGNNKLFTFKYDGGIAYTDAEMPDEIKKEFAKQLQDDYEYDEKFDIKKAKQQLEDKKQYRIKM